MTNLISTNGYKLLIVGVPGESFDFDLNVPYGKSLIYHTETKGLGDEVWHHRHFIEIPVEPGTGLPVRIVGTIKNTPPLVWDFDLEKYVGCINREEVGRITYFPKYLNYMAINSFFDTAGESFLSLLEANGWVKDNPFGEKRPYVPLHGVGSGPTGLDISYTLKRWQEAEARRWKQLVVILLIK